MGDYFEGRERCEAGSHEELSAVGDETLNDARACVEDAGASAVVNAIAVGKVLRDFAYAEDGDCVVGGAKVREAHEHSDATFGPSAATDTARELVDEVGDAAIDADKFQYATSNHRNQDEFAHAADAACHGRKPSFGIESAHADAYQSGKQVAYEQHDEHVLTHQRQYEYGEVGEHLDELRKCDVGRSIMPWRVDTHNQVNNRCEESGRQGDADVRLELVAHLYALRAGGNDGGVGDERQVVAKECTAHGGRNDERCGNACFGSKSCCHRRERYDGAHGGADAHAHEAGGDEYPWQQHAFGQQREGEVHGSINSAHGLGTAGKGARHDEYPHHEEQIPMASTARKVVDAFVHAVAACDEQGIGCGEDEYEQQWHFVEILKADASRQEAGYEHRHRADGEQSVALSAPWFRVGGVRGGHDVCVGV